MQAIQPSGSDAAGGGGGGGGGGAATACAVTEVVGFLNILLPLELGEETTGGMDAAADEAAREASDDTVAPPPDEAPADAPNERPAVALPDVIGTNERLGPEKLFTGEAVEDEMPLKPPVETVLNLPPLDAAGTTGAGGIHTKPSGGCGRSGSGSYTSDKYGKSDRDTTFVTAGNAFMREADGMYADADEADDCIALPRIM